MLPSQYAIVHRYRIVTIRSTLGVDTYLLCTYYGYMDNNEGHIMALHHIPRYQQGVALTEQDGTWYVVTDTLHPYGADVVGYPTYADAYQGWTLTVKDA